MEDDLLYKIAVYENMRTKAHDALLKSVEKYNDNRTLYYSEATVIEAQCLSSIEQSLYTLKEIGYGTEE